MPLRSDQNHRFFHRRNSERIILACYLYIYSKEMITVLSSVVNQTICQLFLYEEFHRTSLILQAKSTLNMEKSNRDENFTDVSCKCHLKVPIYSATNFDQSQWYFYKYIYCNKVKFGNYQIYNGFPIGNKIFIYLLLHLLFAGLS